MDQNMIIAEEMNMEIQEVLNPEVVDYFNAVDKVGTFKMIKGLASYATILLAILGVFITGYKLDGTNTNIKTTTEHVLVGTYNNDYTDEKYDDLILIRDSVGVSEEVKKEVREIVADELSYFTDEFITEFLQNTKFEIEIRDTYCYNQGLGRNFFLHSLDDITFSKNKNEGYARAYFEGNQGILRVHVYMQEENIAANVKDSLCHELGHYFDTASFRYSSSPEFLAIYDMHKNKSGTWFMVTPAQLEDGTYYDCIQTNYPISKPCEFFAEYFQQYVKHPGFLEDYYPDVFEYFNNLLEK